MDKALNLVIISIASLASLSVVLRAAFRIEDGLPGGNLLSSVCILERHKLWFSTSKQACRMVGFCSSEDVAEGKAEKEGITMRIRKKLAMSIFGLAFAVEEKGKDVYGILFFNGEEDLTYTRQRGDCLLSKKCYVLLSLSF